MAERAIEREREREIEQRVDYFPSGGIHFKDKADHHRMADDP